MTVERALRLLIEMDQQIVCPRPSSFGEMAHLLRAVALEANTIYDGGDTPMYMEWDDFGDISGLAEDNFWQLPKDAEDTWRSEDRS
jgi:hypothetical protein